MGSRRGRMERGLPSPALHGNRDKNVRNHPKEIGVQMPNRRNRGVKATEARRE